MGDIPPEKYYVTPQEVRDYLGVSYTTGIFSDANLSNIIEQAMGRVDYITNMVWNGRRRKVREWHSLTRYEGGWLLGVGYPIYVGHKYIDQVTSLRVYWGDEYKEFVGTYEPARNKMTWWVEDIDGIIYIRKYLIKYTDKEVIVEYTYGRDDLPYHVKRLTLLYVVRDILRNSRFISEMPEGMGVGLKEELADIEKEISELENMNLAVRKAINMVDLGEVV